MSHLIFSRNANNSVLSDNEIAHKAPAIFSDTKAARLTNRYASLQTSSLLPVMADYGYFPTQAAQKRSRKGTPEHSSHLIAFSRADDMFAGDIRPEIVLYNSHDGTSAVKLFAGAFRFICSNGIVAGEGFNAKVNHTVNGMRGFEDMLRGVVDSMPKLMDTISTLKQRQLDADQRYQLAKQAVTTRWNILDTISDVTPKGVYATEQTVQQALSFRRYEDSTADAFTVWNRLQENILRGHLFVRSVTNNEGYVNIKDRKARPVNSVSEHVRINRELFDLVA
jgi:hypothetical protein